MNSRFFGHWIPGFRSLDRAEIVEAAAANLLYELHTLWIAVIAPSKVVEDCYFREMDPDGCLDI
jgi:hypothetical protein